MIKRLSFCIDLFDIINSVSIFFSSNVVTLCSETLKISSFESNKLVYTKSVSRFTYIVGVYYINDKYFIFHNIEHGLKKLHYNRQRLWRSAILHLCWSTTHELIKTSLVPPLFIEVPVPSQESEMSCMCVFGVSMLPLSTISKFHFKIVWHFCFPFYH